MTPATTRAARPGYRLLSATLKTEADMLGLLILIAAILAQPDPRSAMRATLPATMSLLPLIVPHGGVSGVLYLPLPLRQHLAACPALLLTGVAGSRLCGALGNIVAGFVLPAAAEFW